MFVFIFPALLTLCFALFTSEKILQRDAPIVRGGLPLRRRKRLNLRFSLHRRVSLSSKALPFVCKDIVHLFTCQTSHSSRKPQAGVILFF